MGKHRHSGRRVIGQEKNLGPTKEELERALERAEREQRDQAADDNDEKERGERYP